MRTTLCQYLYNNYFTRLFQIVFIIGLLLTLGLYSAIVNSQEVRVRKNIDDISSTDLANYLHAIKILKDTPNADWGSEYNKYVQMHNGAAGPCEHGRDTFLFWHRAHLLIFENALRATDPPRTSNVTLPYWNWSEIPSGKRYPKDFERAGELYDNERFTTPICRTNNDSNCDDLPFPRQRLDNNEMTLPWSGHDGFGGDFLGGPANCERFTYNGKGAFELNIHDFMHGNYVGGKLADPSQAADDPIFWSFHTYFDLLLAQWQKLHPRETITCLDCQLCGMEKTPGSTTVFKVKELLNIRSQLKYDYEYKPQPSAITERSITPTTAFKAHTASDFALSRKIAPVVTKTISTKIPKPGFKSVKLHLSGLKLGVPFSYEGDIYLYPKATALRPRDASFRDKYLVDLFFNWKHTHAEKHEADHKSTVTAAKHHIRSDQLVIIDLTAEFTSLAQSHAGAEWTIALLLTVDTRKVRDPIQYEHKMVPENSSFSEYLHFDDMSLKINPAY